MSRPFYAHASIVTEGRTDLSERLASQVVSLIRNQNLQPGDRLPPLKELAKLFSVAPSTMREALRRLQATNVIEIRHGSGVYVRKIDQGYIITNPHHGKLHSGTVMQLLDARVAIEPYLAGKAAQLATDADLASLQMWLETAEQLLNGQDAELQPTNMQFHCQIARVSRNLILAEFLESLVQLYAREQLGILKLFNARTRDYLDHASIFEAIRSHDAALASQRMEHHLMDVRETVAQRLFSQRD